MTKKLLTLFIVSMLILTACGKKNQQRHLRKTANH